MAYSPKTILTLNRLIETCINGTQGYHLAANMVEEQQYKLLFRSIASQRTTFVHTLQNIVTQYGGEPTVRETPMLAAAHRGWMKLRATINSQTPLVVLSECKRGDATALANYQNALAHPLPGEIKSIVSKQNLAIRAVYERIHALHDVLQLNLQIQPPLLRSP